MYCLCKCVLYYCHRVSTQLQFTNISICGINNCKWKKSDMHTDDEKSTSNWHYEASCTSHCDINRGFGRGTHESLHSFCTVGRGVGRRRRLPKNVIRKVRELRFRNSFSLVLLTICRYLAGKTCIVCQANSTKEMEKEMERSTREGWGGEVLH